MENWMIWAALVIFAFFLIALYNRLVSLRETRKNAFSDIDVQLKLRCDLVPNLVEAVKGYAAHEKGVFENVTTARSRAMQGGAGPERMAAEGTLTRAMINLMAVAENYPALKADANFQRLQAELSDIENKIAAARRFFNNATNEYNTGIQQFPAVLFARALGFSAETFFELDAADAAAAKTAPQVKF